MNVYTQIMFAPVKFPPCYTLVDFANRGPILIQVIHLACLSFPFLTGVGIFFLQFPVGLPG